MLSKKKIEDFKKIGIEECKHHNLPMTCTECKKDLQPKWFNKRGYTIKELEEKTAIEKILSDPKEKPKFYECLCSIKFGEIFGKKLSKMNLYSYQFDGGSFNNFNILTEYKSATYDGPSNYSNFVHSLLKMIIAELHLGKPVLKVMVFRSKTLAESFLKNEFKNKFEILLSSCGIKPNSVQIWHFNGSDEPEKL